MLRFVTLSFFALTMLMVPCAIAGVADTVGASHNSVNAVGRNRTNVVYNQAKTATPITPTQPIMQPVALVSDTEQQTDDDAPPPSIPGAPEPEPVHDLTPDIAKATQYIEQLKSEIKQIDSEIARCKKAKTNWTIGTVVGGTGVVGTATGAIIQAVQINKAKKNSATESTPEANSNNNSAKESE